MVLWSINIYCYEYVKNITVIQVKCTKIILLIFLKQTNKISILLYDFKIININVALSVHEDGNNSQPSAARRTFSA